MKKSVKTALIVSAAAVTLLGATAAGLYMYKQNREAKYNSFIASNTAFYNNSVFNGESIGGKTPSEVIDKFEEEFNTRTVTVSFEGKTSDISVGEMNVDFTEFENKVNEAYENQKMSYDEFYNGALLKEYSFSLGDLLKSKDISIEKISKDIGINNKASEDATFSYNPEDGSVDVVKEVYGNMLPDGYLEGKVADAVRNNEISVEITKDDFVKPKLISDSEQFLAKKDKIAKYFGKKITVNACYNKIEITPEELRKMYSIDSDIEVNEDAVREYISGLKSKLDTYNTKRKFTTSVGTEIVIPGGNYGWCIKLEDTLEAFKTALLSENAIEKVDAVYSAYGQRRPGKEISNTYLEVSIEYQHVWMYIDGQLIVNDDCCTGEELVKEGSQTNRGMFRLSYKQRDCVLRGSDYEEPVSYWIPFDGGIGLHDATWREDWEFGGTNYMGNGSHGCVNLRLATAETIYNNLTNTMPIIVW